ncbi:MAG TPA: YdcF family protein [Candidatus Dormibacteraeota bacterium]|nr:YdcF family protein [Candidatus Dormibacteraeota bacterium]
MTHTRLHAGRRHARLRHAEHGGIISTLIGLLFLVVLCGAVYLARGPLLRFAGESWIVDETFDHADAIIVLSDDNFYADRVTRAAELMRDGKAPIVVASGRRLRPYAGIAELMQHDLIERGVPKEKIVVFAHDGDSTRDEAEALTNLIAEKKWTTVMLVTSNYHTRRARYIFRKVFPSNVRLVVVSARDGDFDAQQWWQKRKSLRYFSREFFGMIVAMWELRDYRGGASHGKNETKSPSQSVVGVVVPKPLLVV